MSATNTSAGGHHQMPHWITWLQDNVLMSLLMACSGFIFGIALCQGWVANIEDPGSWGIFQWIGVVLFFAAGFAAGGLALRTSYKAATSFGRGDIGFGLVNMIGCILIALAEVWCSLAERSGNLKPTVADVAVLSAFAVQHPAISITVVIVSILPSFIGFFWGFSQEKEEIEDPELVKRRGEVALLKQQQKAQMAVAKAETRTAIVGAYAKGAVKGIQGALGTETSAASDASEPESPTESTEPVTPSGEQKVIKLASPGIAKGFWKASDYRSYIEEEYGKTLSEDEAKAIVKFVGKGETANAAGKPFVARTSALKRYASTQYSQQTANEA